MTPTSDTDRTDPQGDGLREFRKNLIFACNDPGHFVGFRDERSLGEWQADALLAGPLAQLRSDLRAAEAERDEAQKARKEDRAWYEMTVSVVEEQRENYRDDSLRLHREKMDRLERALVAEANLIALAKMYGEACWKMVQALACVQDLSANNLWLGEQLHAAEAERDLLRTRVGELEKLQRLGRDPSGSELLSKAEAPTDLRPTGEYFSRSLSPTDWLPMNDAPTGVPIIAKHKPNAAMPDGWVATIKLGHGDDEEAGCYDTILHYNGTDIYHNFRGVWTGWMPLGSLPKIALSYYFDTVTRRADYYEGRAQYWCDEAQRLAWQVRKLGGNPEPAPCDGSGEADETQGLSPQGDSAVTEGQAPDLHPSSSQGSDHVER